MKKLIIVALALFLIGCAHLSKDEIAAINSLTYEQKQQLLYEMLKAQYATPPPPPVYFPPYQANYRPEPSHTYCYPDGSGGMSCNTY